jgi:hypothetical protein
MARLHIFLAGAAVLAAGAAQAQTSQVTQGSITVMDPATLGAGAPLGAVAITRPKSGSGSRDVSSASYTVGGLAGETFTVAVPSTVSLTRAGSGETLEMALTPSSTHGQVSGAAGFPGQVNVGVSGRLPVSSTTAGGLYVGEFGLTVAYP